MYWIIEVETNITLATTMYKEVADQIAEKLSETTKVEVKGGITPTGYKVQCVGYGA